MVALEAAAVLAAELAFAIELAVAEMVEQGKHCRTIVVGPEAVDSVADVALVSELIEAKPAPLDLAWMVLDWY